MPGVRVYAVINQKGGVGKTTTVANLGAAIAARGRDVFLIDLDPQAHLTLHFGIEANDSRGSVYGVMTEDLPIDSATISVAPRLWVAPSTIDLAAAEIELASTVGREQILRDRLAESPSSRRFVLIDCPPSLGLLTLNALAAADEVLIPLQPHFLGLQGLGKLLETVCLVQRRINPKLRVMGVIFCMYETTTRLAGEVAADLKAFLAAARGSGTPWASARIFATRIRRNIKLAECPSHGRTIFQYEPNSHGAEDYLALADEFLAACDQTPASPGEEAPQAEAPQGEPSETQAHMLAEAPPSPPSAESDAPTDHAPSPGDESLEAGASAPP